MSSQQQRTKSLNRDSGTFHEHDEAEVVTSQPTANISVLHPDIRKRHDPEMRESCCMFKVGCISFGVDSHAYQDGKPRSPSHASAITDDKPRSPSHASAITDCSDSAFFDGISWKGSPRPSSAVCDINEQSEGKDAKSSPKEQRRNLNKRVSFLDVKRHERCQVTSPESIRFTKATKENDELRYILQCIEDSKEHYQPTAYNLTGKRIELENFCGSFLTNQYGGKLTIPGTAISLYVPPGAVLSHTSDEPQFVYIYRRLSKETPKLSADKKETLATPIIECGPSVKFAKPVYLSMPYKLKVDISQLQVSGYRSKNSSFCNNWKGLRDGDDAVVVPQQNEVTIILDHFCKYGCTVQQASSGDSKKWMKVTVKLVDAKLDGSTEDNCTIEVLVCDITDNMDKEHLQETADDGEIKVKASSEHDEARCSEILVNNYGGSMNIAVNGVDEHWKLREVSLKQIQCNHLWTYQSPPRVTFDSELRDGFDVENSPFCANVDIYQDGNAQPSITLRAISRSHAEPTPLNSRREQIRQTIDEQFLETKFPRFAHFERQERYHHMCVALENAMDTQGWKQLAHHIGFERIDTMQWMDTYSQRSGNNPSSVLLEFFFKDTTEENILHKMRCLSNLLLKTDNGAAKRYVDEEIADRMRAEDHTASRQQSAFQERITRGLLRHQSESGPSGASDGEPLRQQHGKRNRLRRTTSLVMNKTIDSWHAVSQFLSRPALHMEDRTNGDDDNISDSIVVAIDDEGASLRKAGQGSIQSVEQKGLVNPGYCAAEEKTNSTETDAEVLSIIREHDEERRGSETSMVNSVDEHDEVPVCNDTDVNQHSLSISDNSYATCSHQNINDIDDIIHLVPPTDDATKRKVSNDSGMGDSRPNSVVFPTTESPLKVMMEEDI